MMKPNELAQAIKLAQALPRPPKPERDAYRVVLTERMNEWRRKTREKAKRT